MGSHATVEGATSQSSNTFREVMGTAYFWPTQDGAPAQHGTRQLQGEIDVRKSLRPTFVFPRFSLRVSTARDITPRFSHLLTAPPRAPHAVPPEHVPMPGAGLRCCEPGRATVHGDRHDPYA